MILKNYNEHALYFLTGSVKKYPESKSNLKSMGGSVLKNVYSTHGNTVVFYNLFQQMEILATSSSVCVSDKGSSQTYGVIFGDGNAEPTVDDYKLSGNLITNISNDNVSKSFTEEYTDTYYKKTGVYTITNTGNETMVIGEVGIINHFSCRKSQYSTDYSWHYNTLMERTKLESPVVIEPGGVGKITYTLQLNFI